ncbi:MarR family transcriptional regulator [Wandonia haliotis]|uniref:MarR family transcriptional regulator n=1 Tax=Wandonia haliotis TaxID=574963 RepID=A0ABP3Y6E5_9FLAO
MSEQNDKKTPTVDFVVRHIWHKIARMYNQKAAEHDVTISIAFILLIIDKEGTPSTQLGPRLGMEPTSLSRTLKAMEEKGLIFRSPDKEDKRKVRIFLTKYGIEQRKLAKSVVLEFNEKLYAKIPKGKLAVFFDVMERIDKIVTQEMDS